MSKTIEKEEESTYEKVISGIGSGLFKIGFSIVKLPVTILYYLLKFIVFNILINFKIICVKSIKPLLNTDKIKERADNIAKVKNLFNLFPVSFFTFIISGCFNFTYNFFTQKTDKETINQEIDDFATFFSWGLTVVFSILALVGYQV